MNCTVTILTPSRAPNVRERRFNELLTERMREKDDILFFPTLYFETLGENIYDEPTLVYQHKGKTYIIDARDEVPEILREIYQSFSFIYVRHRSEMLPSIPEDATPLMQGIPASTSLYFCEKDVHHLFRILRHSSIVSLLPQDYTKMTYSVQREEGVCLVTFKTRYCFEGEEGDMTYTVLLYPDGAVCRHVKDQTYHIGSLVLRT